MSMTSLFAHSLSLTLSLSLKIIPLDLTSFDTIFKVHSCFIVFVIYRCTKLRKMFDFKEKSEIKMVLHIVCWLWDLS